MANQPAPVPKGPPECVLCEDVKPGTPTIKCSVCNSPNHASFVVLPMCLLSYV
jgi:hypothetical protein